MRGCCKCGLYINYFIDTHVASSSETGSCICSEAAARETCACSTDSATSWKPAEDVRHLHHRLVTLRTCICPRPRRPCTPCRRPCSPGRPGSWSPRWVCPCSSRVWGCGRASWCWSPPGSSSRPALSENWFMTQKTYNINIPESAIAFLASVASSTFSYVTKAKPLERPVLPSSTTVIFAIGPNFPNSFSSSLSVV